MSSTIIRRIEKKYFIRADEKDYFIALIKEHMGLKGNPYDKEYTSIQSIYYDSPDLYCYRGHFELENRFKVRARNYWPDGKKLPYSFMELKNKYRSLTEKQRFKYDRVGRKSIPQSFSTKKASRMNNEGVDGIVDTMNQKISYYHLRPLVAVYYDRISFENNLVRITVDSNIRSKIITDVSPHVKDRIHALSFWAHFNFVAADFDSHDYLIVELKDPYDSEEHLPPPIRDFLAPRRRNFSKYCYSVTKSMQ